MDRPKHRTTVKFAAGCEVKDFFVAALSYGSRYSADALTTSLPCSTDCIIVAETGKKYGAHHCIVQEWWPSLPPPHSSETNTIQTSLSENALKLLLDIAYYRNDATLDWSYSPELFDFARQHNLYDIQRHIVNNSHTVCHVFSCPGSFRMWMVAVELGIEQELQIRKHIGRRLTRIIEAKIEPDYTDLIQAPAEFIMLLLDSKVIFYPSAIAQARIVAFWGQKNPEKFVRDGKRLCECIQYTSSAEKARTAAFLRKSFSKHPLRDVQKAQIEKKVYHSFRPRLPENVLLYFGGSTNRSEQDIVYIYDEYTGTWDEVAGLKLPQPSGYLRTVVVGDDIFILDNNFPERNSIHAVNVGADSLRYRWRGAFDSERSYFSHVAYKSQIYFFGGSVNRNRLATCIAFDTSACIFTNLPDLPGGGRSDSAAVLFENNIYVTGGYDGHHTLESVEMYNPELETWSAFPPLKKARSGHAVVIYKGTIYAVGGFCHGSSIRHVEYFDRVRNMWIPTQPLLRPRSNLSAIVFNGKIWAIGGNHSDTDVHSSVEVFDGRHWRFVNKLPKQLVTGSAVVISTENMNVKSILGWNA